MTDILSTIAARTKERVEAAKKKKPLSAMMEEAEKVRAEEAAALGGDGPAYPFELALKKASKEDQIALICEVKKASPSKGVIDEEFRYLEIAADYERAGASAISVLTEPYWFLGSDTYLKEIRRLVKLPILRKDFTVDPYQIYEAKGLGADAVLLICALMEKEKLAESIQIAHDLGLSALTEAHTEEEVRMALGAGARVIGVNNRNLKTFEVDLETSIRLRNMVPESILFISESGIRTPEDIQRLKQSKVNGVLMGETLMRSGDKKQLLSELRGGKQ